MIVDKPPTAPQTGIMKTTLQLPAVVTAYVTALVAVLVWTFGWSTAAFTTIIIAITLMFAALTIAKSYQ